MGIADDFTTLSSEGLFKSLFTNPLSGAFQIWVGIVNFWIFVSCLALAGETVEPYTTTHADLFKLIEFTAVFFLTLDYAGNLYYA